ncbi:MAG: phosphoribosylglycinamide formyltransferase [Syntrophaceae bacterium]
MVRLGVLVSGSGTNLQSILDACAAGGIDARVAVVISNVASAYALNRAHNAGVPTHIVSHKDYPDRDAFDAELVRVLREHKVELVCLAGFMRILTQGFIRAFSGRIMNIHPALLPSFPGLDVRQAAIDHGVRFSGCTVHFVDEGVDTGPIIIQAVVPVYPDDTEESLKDRILKREHQIYPRAIQLYAQGRLSISGRRVLIHDHHHDEAAYLINPPLNT